MKDANLDWETITTIIQEGEQGKIVEVEDDVDHKTVGVWWNDRHRQRQNLGLGAWPPAPRSMAIRQAAGQAAGGLRPGRPGRRPAQAPVPPGYGGCWAVAGPPPPAPRP